MAIKYPPSMVKFVPMPAVKKPAKPCIYKGICPSASNECNKSQSNGGCIPLLDSIKAKLAAQISTIDSIREYITHKEL